MAYNLQPLITILEQILDPKQTRWIFYHNKPQLESLLEKAQSLQQMVENSSSSSLTKIVNLERRIRKAAHKAEDMIESHMVDQMLSTPRGVRRAYFFTPYLHHVMQQLDSATEQVVKLMEWKTTSNGGSSSSNASFYHEAESLKLVGVDKKKIRAGIGAPNFSSSKKDLVGVDADLMQLKDRLTNMQSKLQIIPITGMGGIGKSALARNLFDDSLIFEHFELRGWATISQVYNMRAILLSLLHRPNEKLNHELIGLKDCELKDILYRRLFGRRYMIVLDDVWSTKLWDEIRIYLPNNNNGSRILITTRESSVANDANWSTEHRVQFLDESKSWDLLRQIVFGKEDCPLVLQQIGEKIASDCGGLPLAINVIGGLLSKVERSRDVWEHISSDVKVTLVESDEQFPNILSLSYNHLPFHLKPCLLYVGALREDYEVKGSELRYLWVAEGFVESNGDKSLEEEAEDYLKALVERNLLMVTKKKYNGKPMKYAIHDLLRDLCIRKANEEKFMHIKNSPNDVSFSSERRVCINSSYDEMEDLYASPQVMSLARSFMCAENEILFPMFSVLRLVRVLDVMEMVFEEFPEEILQLVNLCYLAFSCFSGLPRIGISRLWNLQTLISKQERYSLTSDLWEISELRHLRLSSIVEIEEGYKMKFVHKKLQTIYYVRITPSLIRNGFFEIIPNIIDVGIYYIDSPDVEIDLSHLHKLEILRCLSELDSDGSRFLPNLIFPLNLRKLTLLRCVIFRSLCTTLCALSNLEVLKIVDCVFESEADQEWEAAEGDEFCSLQLLQLNSLDIVRWRADETNFPTLRQLLVYSCNELEEIPGAIGDIPTLQLIGIWKCSASLVASAQEIQKVQQDEFDNYDLQVQVDIE